ncbi:hypothetical protein [Rosistilla oblonga]|uniref:hypothetical protein n=1 Tax=Rosistilla oblonga TaxID=2527990 RepID=UPI003A972C83
MDESLRQLLNRLDVVGLENEEIYDSECREQMSRAVMDGFVRGSGVDSLADDFGLRCPEANRSVKSALADYIEACNREAAKRRLMRFHDRLVEFQNSEVRSDVEGNDYDDYFGHAKADWFDHDGQMMDGP